MKRSTLAIVIATVMILIGWAIYALAQDAATNPYRSSRPPVGQVVRPQSGIERPEDIGVRFHTNFEVYMLPGDRLNNAPPASGYGFETPASIACIYGLVTATTGCNPNTVTTDPSGGSKTIVILDAYHNPTAEADLSTFSTQFGLPFSSSQFKVVYATGHEPAEDPSGDAELEESLDVQWAHAMAPSAKIYLVEAASFNSTDITTGLTVATNLVQCGKTTTCSSVTGAGEVSMSFGGTEFSGETSGDSAYDKTNVVFVASSGDDAGIVQYPCTSPNVVCVGGTSTRRSLKTSTLFNLLGQSTWESAGGGFSMYETGPSYQTGVSGVQAGWRSVPDVSFDANPVTGAWVYDSNGFEGTPPPIGWIPVAGTSLAAPAMAGLLNNAAGKSGGSFAASSAAELTKIYSNRSVAADFKHPNYGGFCGYYVGFTATTTQGDWDPCTGIGYPVGYAGK